ncbi:MAG: DUF447 family protein, partial [Methanobrevibacter sp.]|nr:DUF447 family protein [Methanobrevibacter sp.]
NGELVKNAAPIGVICKDSNHVVIHLDNCVHTHLNILENGELIVNITKDPLVFTYSTLGELDDEYFDEFKGFPMIKDSIGFFKAHVVKTRNKKRENDYNDGIGNIVTCEVDDIYISDYKEIVPLNRAMNAVIESLIYYCRFDHKYAHMQNEIWTHMKELNRVCHKVGNESEKKSMELILAKMKETHDYLE